MEIAFGQPVTQQFLALSVANTCISSIFNEITGGGVILFILFLTAVSIFHGKYTIANVRYAGRYGCFSELVNRSFTYPCFFIAIAIKVRFKLNRLLQFTRAVLFPHSCHVNDQMTEITPPLNIP